MKDFLFFESKATILFKKFSTSGTDFGILKTNINSFLKYMNSEFPKNLDLYKTSVDVDNISLENVIDPKYKFLFRGTEFRHIVQFLMELEGRIKDFDKKEVNLRTVISFYFLYYVLVVKLVETYLGAIATYNVNDPSNPSKYTLRDIGIDSSVLRYFASLEDLRTKTIDDWLALDIDAINDRYYVQALKRIFAILGSY